MLIRTGRRTSIASQPTHAVPPLLKERDPQPRETYFSQNSIQNQLQVTLQRKLLNTIQNGTRTWSLLNKHKGNPKLINVLLNIADSLEIHTSNLLQLHSLRSTYHKLEYINTQQLYQSHNSDLNFEITDEISPIIQFYQSPSLFLHKKHKSSSSLRSQLLSKPLNQPTIFNTSNSYHYLQDTGGETGGGLAQGALCPLLPPSGYEEMLVVGKVEQLQRPRMWQSMMSCRTRKR